MHPSEFESPADRKNRGAYYTDPAVAAALCAWALSRATDAVLDPSFGAGVFLRAAADRLAQLGGRPSQVHGIEMDAGAYAAGAAVGAAAGVPLENLERRDFFARSPRRRFDAVVGNPPYIRFQRLSVRTRTRALTRAHEAGVELSGLASSWAPFVVHSANLVAAGGRLAMLVPSEIGQARYGRGVLAFLARAFERVTFVAFDRRLFPELEQETWALLAVGRGGAGGDLRFARVDGLAGLGSAAEAAAVLGAGALSDGSRKMRFFELPSEVRAAYEALEGHASVPRLEDVGRVTSGYVTGNNAFFHLSPRQARELSLPATALSRAVFRARALVGLSFDEAAWTSASASGGAGYLLTPSTPPEPATQDYLRAGERAGVDTGYKTRRRSPWYGVPRVDRPDMLMSAMAAESHALAMNHAGAAPANTLHAVSLSLDRSGGQARPRENHADATSGAQPIGASGRDALLLAAAVAWLTSLSQLSRELEGRVLGGGMLKLEPGEAGNVLLPALHRVDRAEISRVAGAIDDHLRAGRRANARRAADAVMLRSGLGLSAADVRVLEHAVGMLRSLRKRSGRGAS